MKKISIVGMVAGIAMLWAPVSQAGVIYSRTFNTDTSDFLGSYGFSQSGMAASNCTASGGQAIVTTSSQIDYKLYTAPSLLPSYDWSVPLTLSADLGSNRSGAGPVTGIYLGNGSGVPLLGWLVYWTTPTDWQAYVSDNAFAHNIRYSQNYRIPSTTNLYNFSLTIRQDASDSSKFDLLVQLNGTNQVVSTTSFAGNQSTGIYQSDGWIMGLSKAGYGINNTTPFGTIGFWNSGTGTLNRYDNLTLSTIPEPGSLTLLGFLGGALLLRRKLRQSR